MTDKIYITENVLRRSKMTDFSVLLTVLKICNSNIKLSDYQKKYLEKMEKNNETT